MRKRNSPLPEPSGKAVSWTPAEILVDSRLLCYKRRGPKIAGIGWRKNEPWKANDLGCCRPGGDPFPGSPDPGAGVVPGGRGRQYFSVIREAYAPSGFFPGGPSGENGSRQGLQGESIDPELLGHLVTQLPEGGSFSGKIVRPLPFERVGGFSGEYQGKSGDDQ